MIYSKKTIRFVDNIILDYSHFDNNDNRYDLSLNKVPDFLLHELCACLMKDEPELGFEATSPNNPHYEQKMLPALITYLSDVTEKDNEIEYLCEWKKGIYKYLSKFIDELIEDRVSEYNQEKREFSTNIFKDAQIWI